MSEARIPAVIYFLKPKTPQIATAIGAESWNSVPGTMPGMRKVPDTAIRTARSAVSQQSMMSFLSLVAQMAFSFCMFFSFVKMGGRGQRVQGLSLKTGMSD